MKNASYKPKYPSVKQAQEVAAQRKAERDSNPFPAKVTQSEFLNRDLETAIRENRCTVTISGLFGEPVAVLSVEPAGGTMWNIRHEKGLKRSMWFEMSVVWHSDTLSE